MADHGTVELGTATGTDYNDHLQTYTSFLGFLKFGCSAIVILLILMAYFLL
jgi:hypothetical protein